MKRKYFECQCSSPEHRLVLSIDDDLSEEWPPELYTEVYLRTYGGFFKRVWTAFKYIFGWKCKHGHFDCFILKPEDVADLQLVIDEYTTVHNAWVKQLKKETK